MADADSTVLDSPDDFAVETWEVTIDRDTPHGRELFSPLSRPFQAKAEAEQRLVEIKVRHHDAKLTARTWFFDSRSQSDMGERRRLLADQRTQGAQP